MFALYLKIIFRNMWKHKAQSLTGIIGLAFGLACIVPALYWLRYETSYDCFYPNSKQIYRVYSYDKQTGKTNDLVSGILEKKLQEQFPAMQSSTVFFIEQNNCSTERTPHIRLLTLFTDSSFFHVFQQTVISGSAQRSLDVINNIVLTKTVAIRLFGNPEKAIGQQIKSRSLTDDLPYTVTAVVKDPPANTNLSFDAILSHEQIKLQKSFPEKTGKEIWTFAFLQMYVKLPQHTSIDHLTKQLRDFLSHSNPNSHVELQMLPVSDIRHQLVTDTPFTMNFVRLFVIAGILLLFSALFNFINLHFNLFRQRMREFRLRAVNGASCSSLIQQMSFELACTVCFALLPAGYIVILIHPIFGRLLHITIEMPQLISIFAVCSISILLLILAVGFILFWRLSQLAIRPQSERKITEQRMLQRIAVISQLTVSMVFIVATLVVMMQMRFVNQKNLGFDRHGIIYLSGLQNFINNDIRETLIKELASIPQIEKITDTDFTPQHSINPFKITTNVEWQEKQQSEKPAFNYINTDSQFAEIFKVNMLKGKWLNEGGESEIVLNEEAVRVMGLSEPIGAIIRITFNDLKEYRIVGVVRDFHTLSLRSRIHPTIFFTSKYLTNNLYIRTIPGQEQKAIQQINTILPKIDATLADVQPTLLSELYDRLNYSEQIGLKVFSVLAIICLLISLFGIYAIASATTLRRRKEIAIRKIVGAKAGSIVHMFFHEYILQVAIAGTIALPVAYIIMSNWLEGYAYRTSIPWWLMAGVVTGVITVVLLTVLGQILKAANCNPAEVVKNE